MKVAEMMVLFQQMPASDRLYLLCKMLPGCLAYELNYISIVLRGYLKERLSGMTELLRDANSVSHYAAFKDLSLVSKEPLEKLSACLALNAHDNRLVGDEIYDLLNQRDILTMAEEVEDVSVFENLRLVYVMAVYHPSLSFQKRHHLLNIYLNQLDEIYNSKVAEKKAREIEEKVLEQSKLMRPDDSAHIVHCELIGFFKRQSDRRYAYVIDVKWSDGASCNVQRTYGDFFGFQNKLLDLFPDESGQKSKKSRVIPFLPGRRLLSGKSNRELAEKRLPDLHKYTRDLFLLPGHISSHKHVQDFFRPHLSDQKDFSSLHKLTTLSDIKESSNKNRHPSAPPSVLSSNSPKSRSAFQTGLLSSLSSGRNAQTLPPEKSPGPQRDLKVKHSTLPNQSAFTPIAPNTPSSSTERLNSSSQTSLGSIDRLLVTPTTTACHVVTPTTTRANGSPAFSVSHTMTTQLTSSSWSNVLTSESLPPSSRSRSSSLSTTDIRTMDNDLKSNISTTTTTTTTAAAATTTTSIATTTTSTCSSSQTTASTTSVLTVTTANISNSSWAECSPPADTGTAFQFSSHETSSSKDYSPYLPTTTMSSVFRPIQTTARKTKHLPVSPSFPHLQHSGGSGRSQHVHSYPVSYTPTNFESPSPSPKHMGVGMGGRWQSSYGPLCTTPVNATPTSEAEQCRKWLKVHRLHKYEHLFQDMTFSKMSSLTVDDLKELGMTLGAAKKLQQKMEELKQNNVHSFCDIPHSSLTRKPSTSSLPAALLLQERGLTPSSSIDQISLIGSTCSLDVLGQTPGGGNAQQLSDGPNTDGVLSKIDCAIVEAGPVNGTSKYAKNDVNTSDSSNCKPHRSRETVIRSKSSYANTNNCNSSSNGLHAPSRSVDSTPTHSPLKIQRSLSPHHLSHLRAKTPPTRTQQTDSSVGGAIIGERIHGVPEKALNRSSLPTPPTNSQQTFSAPQFHRKDVHSLPSNISEGQDGGSLAHHHHPKIPPPMFLPSSRLPNWSLTPVLHGGPVVVPNSAPIIRGRVPGPPVLHPGYQQQAINGLLHQPQHSINLAHVGLHRVPSYPLTGPSHSVGVASTLSCYNCGKAGHYGSACIVSNKSDSSPARDYHFHYGSSNSQPLPSSTDSSPWVQK